MSDYRRPGEAYRMWLGAYNSYDYNYIRRGFDVSNCRNPRAEQHLNAQWNGKPQPTMQVDRSNRQFSDSSVGIYANRAVRL